MQNTNKVWFPRTKGLSEAQRAALSVPGKPTSATELKDMMEAKLAKLIKADPQAEQHLAMSEEHAPELFQIKQQAPKSQWASALANSDGMASLLAKVNWQSEQKPTGLPVQKPEEISLQELLEQLA